MKSKTVRCSSYLLLVVIQISTLGTPTSNGRLHVYYDSASVYTPISEQTNTDDMYLSSDWHESVIVINESGRIPSSGFYLFPNTSNVQGTQVRYMDRTCKDYITSNQMCRLRNSKLINSDEGLVEDLESHSYRYVNPEDMEYVKAPRFDLVKIGIDGIQSPRSNSEKLFLSYMTKQVYWTPRTYLVTSGQGLPVTRLYVYADIYNDGDADVDFDSVYFIADKFIEVDEGWGGLQAVEDGLPDFDPNLIFHYQHSYPSAYRMETNSMMRVRLVFQYIDSNVYGACFIPFEFGVHLNNLMIVQKIRPDHNIPAGDMYIIHDSRYVEQGFIESIPAGVEHTLFAGYDSRVYCKADVGISQTSASSRDEVETPVNVRCFNNLPYHFIFQVYLMFGDVKVKHVSSGDSSVNFIHSGANVTARLIIEAMKSELWTFTVNT